MIIPFSTVNEMLKKQGITVNGILHVGAHTCEEMDAYKSQGISEESIAWIEAQGDLVQKMKDKGVPNIFQHCILDVETTVPFWKTTNGESSSVLEFQTHATHHPHVKVCGQDMLDTITLKRFLDDKPQFAKFNFWNLDIQGVELRAIKSAGDYINNVDAIYTEVNTEEVYQGCDQMSEITEYLTEKGFALMGHHIFKEYGWGDALYYRVKKIVKMKYFDT